MQRAFTALAALASVLLIAPDVAAQHPEGVPTAAVFFVPDPIGPPNVPGLDGISIVTLAPDLPTLGNADFAVGATDLGCPVPVGAFAGAFILVRQLGPPTITPVPPVFPWIMGCPFPTFGLGEFYVDITKPIKSVGLFFGPFPAFPPIITPQPIPPFPSLAGADATYQGIYLGGTLGFPSAYLTTGLHIILGI